MTEKEWLASEDSMAMLLFHESAASERKLRLFHVACCERVEHLLIDTRSQIALACARRRADDQVELSELRRTGADVYSAWRFSVRRAGIARYGEEFDRMIRTTEPRLSELEEEVLGFDPATNAAAAVVCAFDSPYQLDRLCAASYAAHAVELESGSEAGSRERQIQSLLLRCVFGNPFRPAAFDPAWLTTDVVALARGIYDERAFDRMPILADALQDAGCTNEDMLIHCRDTNQTHVRGCWVVDLVLGKT